MLIGGTLLSYPSVDQASARLRTLSDFYKLVEKGAEEEKPQMDAEVQDLLRG